MLIVINL